ncbi:MAG: sugar phosphorylase [Gammaproteobacteria bacterium]|nr:sugar phosphorylase [Gammaproteobacteria bacterium]MBT8110524.1 sugar phosphorylase [Gammaproteobacteria bacterium]NND48057.1 sugar phosphorylase [Woeseiaceae bacterium]NNL45224.1 sugar phosphorylase [Woeseiaceae bacterium]
MNKSRNSRDTGRLGYLQTLYGEADAAELESGIESLIAKFALEVATSGKPKRLTESDVALITYGDTLNESNTPPLRVLHRFHREYLAGIFDLIHILPFHPFSSDDGFSVIDYKAIREDLGDWKDVESLSKDCRIMADAVINHMSSQSRWFKEYLAGNPEFADFFIDYDPDEDLSAVVRPRTSPLLSCYKDASGRDRHIWTTFSADQVDLNFRNPSVLLAVIDVLFFLISKGATLLRLDAVTFLWKKPGTACANLEGTHALIKIMRSAVSELREDVVAITETNVPHRENVAYFGNGYDEAHMVYNFALPPLIAHSLIQGDGRHLSQWANGLSLPSDEVCFFNFSASHDGVGVRPVEEILNADELQHLVDATLAAKGKVSSRTMSDGKQRPYELNCTFLDLVARAGEPESVTVSRFVAAQAIVLAMPGVPAIYIQSLLGTRNDIDLMEETGRARSINRSKHEYSTIEGKLADKNGLESKIFTALTRLIRIRREQAAFNPYAAFKVIDLGDSIFALLRGGKADGQQVLSIINLSGNNVDVQIAPDLAGIDLLTNKPVPEGKHTLPAYAVRWLSS